MPPKSVCFGIRRLPRQLTPPFGARISLALCHGGTVFKVCDRRARSHRWPGGRRNNLYMSRPEPPSSNPNLVCRALRLELSLSANLPGQVRFQYPRSLSTSPKTNRTSGHVTHLISPNWTSHWGLKHPPADRNDSAYRQEDFIEVIPFPPFVASFRVSLKRSSLDQWT